MEIARQLMVMPQRSDMMMKRGVLLFQGAIVEAPDLSPIGYGARKWWACPNPTSVVSEVGSEVGFWENRLISGGNNSNT